METPEKTQTAVPTVTKEKIRRVAGDLEVTDITPENLKDEIPVLLIQGWAETPKTHTDTTTVITEKGRRVIAIKTPRIGGPKPEGDYPEAEYTKARALVDALNKKEIKTADIIAHSEGALAAIIAAEIFASQNQPHRIRNIVFVEPVGLIGSDNLRSLFGRWVKMLSKDAVRLARGSMKEKGNLLRALNEANKYSISNPARTIRETGAIIDSNTYESLTRLKELGIKTSVIYAVGDTLYPIDRLLKTVKEKGGLDTTGFYSVKGDHREISVHPEKYAALAINALDALKAKDSV